MDESQDRRLALALALVLELRSDLEERGKRRMVVKEVMKSKCFGSGSGFGLLLDDGEGIL